MNVRIEIVVALLFTGLSQGAITSSYSQSRFMDRTGKASFFSSAPVEDIEAHSEQVVAVFDTGTGEIAATMLMRSFKFRKALMEEHFNENYVESDKYPKATFKGKVVNLAGFDPTKDGLYSLDVEGEITIHGVTRPLRMKAKASVSGKTIETNAEFPLTVKDFKIDIPKLVVNNIAEVVEVKVSFVLKPM